MYYLNCFLQLLCNNINYTINTKTDISIFILIIINDVIQKKKRNVVENNLEIILKKKLQKKFKAIIFYT